MIRPPKPAAMTLNLAPMVDVMMCLIIFFLVASKMVTMSDRVDRPWAIAADEVEGANLGNRVTISVARANDQDLEAVYIISDWDGQQVVERELQAGDVAGLLQSRASAAARDGHALRCVINADKRVCYKHVEVVLRGCGLAKIGDVVFTAKKGLDPKAPT
jgi:biopolymer transport protein ExbD